MYTTTSITLTPSYKGNVINFILSIFLATLMGPFIIFMIVHTAISNNVTDLLSWCIGGVASLLFVFLSYTKFKYIYFTYFKEHTVEINHTNKSIFFLPFKETVLLENVTGFVYRKKIKSYIFTYKNHAQNSFEIKRNETFEKLLTRFSLSLNIE